MSTYTSEASARDPEAELPHIEYVIMGAKHVNK
jgi:hypothetical protein